MSENIQEINDLKNKIKQMEKEHRSSVVKKDKIISFDSWFHQRKDLIPKHHRKEVIAADFRSRGLGQEATTDQYDRALRLYGIKI